ncbi:MAG: orotidine-5'-phosphate decarboxylase [Nitrospinales bacterium]
MNDSSLISTKNIDVRERLIFALDLPSHKEALDMVEKLDDSVIFYKLGLELFMAGDYFNLVDTLIKKGKKVFVDLKFFDIPKTVGSAVRQLKDKGASFATVHGNDNILQAAVDEKGDSLKILAVTVLTSLNRGDLDDLGFDCDVDKLVLSRAKRALQLGCDGVISSGREAKPLRENLGNKLLVITPGIRPVDNDETSFPDDQKRSVTVENAFLNGADYIVVGRPIKNADDPYKAAVDIQETIKNIFTPPK